MSTKSIKIDSPLKKAALAVAALACIVGSFFFAKWGLANSASLRADSPELAVYVTTLAPSDPLPHYVAAIQLEKSFAPEDIQKALEEFELAAANAPENYIYWLDLGRARERNGDAEGAEKALRRAQALAPNYSRVQWALGNALLRQGRREEAFDEIQKAASGDPTFAGPAAATAWQFYDGDIDQIRSSIGRSSRLDAALATLLIGQKKYDEALAMWNTIPAEDKSSIVRETGQVLFAKLLEGKKIRQALQVSYDLDNQATRIEPGTITNGGFESPVRPEGAGTFDWQIAPGLQPQIVLSSGKKHGGNNSLLLVFNTSDAKDFRSIGLQIPVEPATDYDLEIFYSSDLKTAAVFKWEILDAAARVIATTEPIATRADWTPLRLRFKSATENDGIIIRLARSDCGQVCPVTGNLWFDDISLRRATR